MLSLSGSLKKCCKKRVKVTQCTVSCKCIPCRITGGKIRVAWFLSALEGADFFGNFGETLRSEYIKQNLCRSSGTCENNECLCENLRSRCYELGVLQLPKKVTKCGKRFFKEECVLLNNNQAIPQIQAEETHEKQGFCASRDNTESLHEEYTQWGNNKKVPFWKKW